MLAGKSGEFKNTIGEKLISFEQDSLYPIKNNDSLIFTPLSVGEILVEISIIDNYGGTAVVENSFQVSSIPFEIDLQQSTTNSNYITLKINQLELIKSFEQEPLPIFDIKYRLSIQGNSEVEKIVNINTLQEISIENNNQEIDSTVENLFRIEPFSNQEQNLTISITDEYGQTQEKTLTLNQIQ